MLDEATLELLARADRLHARVLAELAKSQKLRAQSRALLDRLYDGLTEINEMEAKSHRVLAGLKPSDW